MTKTEAIRRIKTLPYMTAKATGHGSEIRVSYRATAMSGAKKREATAYYTDDPRDALATTMQMCLEIARRDRDMADRVEGTHPQANVTSLRAIAEQAADAVKELANAGLTDLGLQGATILPFPSKKRGE